MASRRQPATGAGPSSSNDSETTVPETRGLANALAEVARLRAMIEAQNTPETRIQSPDQNRLADVLEALSRRLTREEPQLTPSQPRFRILHCLRMESNQPLRAGSSR